VRHSKSGASKPASLTAAYPYDGTGYPKAPKFIWGIPLFPAGHSFILFSSLAVFRSCVQPNSREEDLIWEPTTVQTLACIEPRSFASCEES
jgi:hypothetical protein